MIRIISGLALSLVAGAVQADVWVFDPAIGFDQRFDDNFTIDETNPTQVFASRLVGSIGISREDEVNAFTGFLRADALLTLGDDGSGGEGGELNSNQIGFVEYTRKQARSRFGIRLNARRDTPSRDISSDITDLSQTASDTGLTVTQTENVVRQRVELTPKFSYDLSRRSVIDFELSLVDVTHTTPDPDDAIRTQFALVNPDVSIPDDLSIEDILDQDLTDDIPGPADPFQVLDELDDFDEQTFSFGYRYKLTSISNFTASASFSRFSTETEPDPGVITPFEDLIPDPDNVLILRAPLRNATANTTRLTVGWDTFFTPQTSFGVKLGVSNVDFDRSELFTESDITGLNPDDVAEAIEANVGNQLGFLGSVTAAHSTLLSRYSGTIAFDVLPSNVGSPVESLNITGDYSRIITPLLDFALGIRFFEPDAINADSDDEFSRRFFSFEPRAVWRFTRSWTAAAAYRLRLQSGQLDTGTGTSNALLFTIKYSPPLKIRDLQQGR